MDSISIRRKLNRLGTAALLIAGLALAACRPASSAPTTQAAPTATTAPTLTAQPATTEEVVLPTETTAVSPEPSPTAPPGETVQPVEQTPAQAPVSFPEAGITFTPPSGWSRVEGSNAWTPGTETVTAIGFDWGETEPGVEMEARFLPPNSVIQDSQPVDVNGVGGRRYLVELYGTPPLNGGQAPVIDAEEHVLLRKDGKIYHFYLIAQSTEALAQLVPTLGEVLSSVTWQ